MGIAFIDYSGEVKIMILNVDKNFKKNNMFNIKFTKFIMILLFSIFIMACGDYEEEFKENKDSVVGTVHESVRYDVPDMSWEGMLAAKDKLDKACDDLGLFDSISCQRAIIEGIVENVNGYIKDNKDKIDDALKAVENASTAYGITKLLTTGVGTAKGSYGGLSAELSIAKFNDVMEHRQILPFYPRGYGYKNASFDALSINDNKTTSLVFKGIYHPYYNDFPPGKIKNIYLELDLNHTYIGDLVIKLITPDKVATIWDRKGGSEDDITGTLLVRDLIDNSDVIRHGDWELIIEDKAGGDTGHLINAALLIEIDSIRDEAAYCSLKKIDTRSSKDIESSMGNKYLGMTAYFNSYNANDNELTVSAENGLYFSLLGVKVPIPSQSLKYKFGDDKINVDYKNFDLKLTASFPVYPRINVNLELKTATMGSTESAKLGFDVNSNEFLTFSAAGEIDVYIASLELGGEVKFSAVNNLKDHLRLGSFLDDDILAESPHPLYGMRFSGFHTLINDETPYSVQELHESVGLYAGFFMKACVGAWIFKKCHKFSLIDGDWTNVEFGFSTDYQYIGYSHVKNSNSTPNSDSDYKTYTSYLIGDCFQNEERKDGSNWEKEIEAINNSDYTKEIADKLSEWDLEYECHTVVSPATDNRPEEVCGYVLVTHDGERIKPDCHNVPEGTWKKDNYMRFSFNNLPAGIPDNDSDGTTLSLSIQPPTNTTLPPELSIGKVRVNVDITHTYKGDLKVELVSPQGRSIVLHNKQGASEDNLNITSDTFDFAGENPIGVWKLKVSDHAGQDVGEVDGFSIDFFYKDACQF